MRHFFFAILLISLQERTSAQCIECTSDCDVRELSVVIQVAVFNATICRSYSLHNEVSFVPDFIGSDPHSFISCRCWRPRQQHFAGCQQLFCSIS